MNKLRVNGWDRWQPIRKGRGTPPWIKLYRNLFSNPEWCELTNSEKGELVSIWILAADKSGTIPNNPKTIMRMAQLDEEPNLKKLIELGFFSEINT